MAFYDLERCLQGHTDNPKPLFLGKHSVYIHMYDYSPSKSKLAFEAKQPECIYLNAIKHNRFKSTLSSTWTT